MFSECCLNILNLTNIVYEGYVFLDALYILFLCGGDSNKSHLQGIWLVEFSCIMFCIVHADIHKIIFFRCGLFVDDIG